MKFVDEARRRESENEVNAMVLGRILSLRRKVFLLEKKSLGRNEAPECRQSKKAIRKSNSSKKSWLSCEKCLIKEMKLDKILIKIQISYKNLFNHNSSFLPVQLVS